MDRFTWKAPDGTYQIDNPTAARRITCYDENFRNPFVIYEGRAIDRLGEYEDTSLTPQEIEQMKARMPLHQWAGESLDKMSIFGIPVSKIIELTEAEKQGRLIVLDVKDIHPCRNCNIGWGSISSEGCHSCDETCERLKQYNEKYNK